MIDTINGWDIGEIEYLRDSVLRCLDNGDSLSRAFEDSANHTGRNENSVRNYYYTHLRKKMIDEEKADVRIRDSKEYDTFTKGEIHHLLRYIIMGVSSGKSVRLCANELANGDIRLMLRYQNKYRSIVKRHKELLDSIIEELLNEGYDVSKVYLANKGETNDPILDTSQCLSEFIKTVNFLYDNGLVDGAARKNIIYTKAMVEGEYNKMQKATMLYELYKDKLDNLVKKHTSSS